MHYDMKLDVVCTYQLQFLWKKESNFNKSMMVERQQKKKKNEIYELPNEKKKKYWI